MAHQRAGIDFHKNDNAFPAVDDMADLQAAADRLSPTIIRKQLDYWTLILCPKFYGTYKTAIIRNWFAKRPRFHVHFIPTYGSWINPAQRWFAEITNKRGSHRSLPPAASACSPVK